jgi:hypothetical protein
LAEKPSPPEPDFDGKLRVAIDETIADVLGGRVLGALHEYLTKNYDVTLDEIPYRLNTVFESLEVVLGVRGASAMGWMIAKRFYAKIGLRFVRNENYGLEEYFQQAKSTLLRRSARRKCSSLD